MKIIELEKTFKEFHLNIPYLELESKKIHGFIGGNGCGKTTLCKLIMGILSADKGRIEYGEWNARDITMTMQKPYLMHGTVYENICYPLKLRKQKLKEEEIDDWLCKCGIQDKKYSYAKSLSSGEQQKVSLIRALIFRPKLIMVDETLSNLDPENLYFFEDAIMQMQKDNPLTWIIISHRLALIYKMCDIVHFMQKGKIIESGNCKEILLKSEHKEIRRFVANEMIVEENHGAVEG